MKITEIAVTQKKNLGNYEHIELTANAVLDEGDSQAQSIDRLKALVDHSLNKDDRAKTYEVFKAELAELANNNSPDAEKKRLKINKWMSQYSRSMDLVKGF